MSAIFDPNQGGFEEMKKYTLWTAVAIWRNPEGAAQLIQRRVGQKVLSYLIIT